MYFLRFLGKCFDRRCKKILQYWSLRSWRAEPDDFPFSIYIYTYTYNMQLYIVQWKWFWSGEAQYLPNSLDRRLFHARNSYSRYICYIRYNIRSVLCKSNFHQIKLLPYNMGRGKQNKCHRCIQIFNIMNYLGIAYCTFCLNNVQNCCN